jgi:hypothetical protein
MSSTIVTKKELNVPVGAMLEVADVLIENDIFNDIVGTDEDEDTIIIEVEYSKEQRKIIHKMEDIISNYLEEEEEEDDK